MAKSFKAIRGIMQELCGPTVLIALVVWILHRSLFSGGRLVPSWSDLDLFSVYMPWRYFGFSQWMQGHFPFWNPHVFCGLPFFAQIQSSLLYPISWVNFLFNTASAATLEMALNLCAGAICMYAWARQRGISRCGATLAGAIFPFSGAVYPYVTDGYMSMLASAAWMPLVFLAMDRLLVEKYMSGILIGAAAICLQCLGAQPQLVYYTLTVGGLYLLLQSIGKPRIVRLYIAFFAMWLLGGMLASVQLLPTQMATQFSIRANGVSYEYASTVSLPPENLLEIFVPYPFGDSSTVPYLGRWFLWEMTLYIGLVALVLAAIRIAGMERQDGWRILLLLGVILLLALGRHTPIYWVLYKYLPGFGLFRAPTKFRIMWALLLSVLAGEGWDHIRRGQISPWTTRLTAIGACICILLTVFIHHFDSPNGPVRELLQLVFRSGEYGAATKKFSDPQILQVMQHWMVEQWSIAAALLAVTSLLIYLRGRFIAPAYVLLVIAIGDVFFASVDCSVTSPVQLPFPQQWAKAAITATEHDQRLIFTDGVMDLNLGNTLGYECMWGYDSGQPMRLTKLIAASQGQHPVWADEYIFQIQKISRVFQLLRCRYILQRSSKYPVLQLRDPMPRLQLIGNFVRITDPATIADRLVKDFDFRQSAILESDPVPAPSMSGTAGKIALVHQSINDMEIEADLPAPALLLITDAYAPGWRVRPMERNPNQSDYNVLPADDVLRAIPLAAGHHHFDLYYFPPGLWTGIYISIAGFVIWTALLVGSQWHRFRPRFTLQNQST
jgi:hypothetical protein